MIILRQKTYATNTGKTTVMQSSPVVGGGRNTISTTPLSGGGLYNSVIRPDGSSFSYTSTVGKNGMISAGPISAGPAMAKPNINMKMARTQARK